MAARPVWFWRFYAPGWKRGRRGRGGAFKIASRVVNAVAARVASRIVSRFLQRFVRTVEGEEVAAVRVVLQEGALVLHNLDLNLSGASSAHRQVQARKNTAPAYTRRFTFSFYSRRRRHFRGARVC